VQVKKGTFADRPPTPRKERRERMHAEGGGAAKTAAKAIPAAPAAGKYIPPAARARMLAAGIDPDKQVKSTATISLHDHEKAENLKSGATFAGEKLTASQIKNKKKKEKAARDKEEAEAKGVEAAAAKKAGKASAAPAGGGAAAGAGEKAIANLSPEEKEKRIRNVNKKLRQIDQLKETQASGTTLESNQLEKLKSEAGIRAELAALSL
jgi:uncharacterized protein with WD repeat